MTEEEDQYMDWTVGGADDQESATRWPQDQDAGVLPKA
jgi:hypothetical protein